MSISKLEKVMWVLRNNHTKEGRKVTNKEVRIAIMCVCGTDPRTIRKHRKALKDLGWLTTFNQNYMWITNKDLTES